ncbi:MAG TPA: DUF899 family protein [Rhodanobacter sp.]|nr:DUF899 family protein [Rhodanobacter sp.]
MSQPLHAVRFPGESAAYRVARDRLLHAEIELRQQVEAVAALRRALPPGGQVPVDYFFDDEGDTPVDADVERQVRACPICSKTARTASPSTASCSAPRWRSPALPARPYSTHSMARCHIFASASTSLW